MDTSTKPRNWGTVAEAADRYRTSTQTIRRWIYAGLIYAERVGPRLIRVDLDSLDSLGTPLQYIDPKSTR